MPYSDYEKLVRKLDILRQKLQQMDRDHIVEASARHILMAKLKRTKEAAHEWMEYANKLKARPAACSPGLLAQEPQMLPSDIRDAEDGISAVDILALAAARSPQVNNGLSSVKDISSEKQGLTSPTKESTTLQRVNELPSSQQETMDPISDTEHKQDLEHGANTTTLVDDTDDAPIVVYERPVKRRKTAHRGSIGDTDGLSLYHVKQEPLSPIPMARTETLDLDEVGSSVQTPRRVRRMQRRPNSLDDGPSLRAERSTSEAVEIHESVPRFDEVSMQQTSTAAPTRNVRPIRLSKTTNTSNISTNQQRTPLTPISGNMRRLPSTSKKAQSTTGQRLKRPLSSNAIHTVLEDGDDDLQIVLPNVHTPDPLDRLNALMEGAVPAPGPHRITRASGVKPVSKFKVPPVPQLAKVISDKTPPEPIHHKPPKSIKLPLRELPLNQLNLFDFKRNAKTNHGLDYAFNDAYYGKERRCLPGCIDPRCCGEAMRLLASTLNPSVPRPAIAPSKEEAFLTDEEYTVQWLQGSEWSRKRYRALSQEERAELLLQAQTKYVAEQYGRHRNVSDRRNTPPGFWDGDIPSTQEQEAHQREAQEMERALVADRYKEALKRGEWLFNDE